MKVLFWKTHEEYRNFGCIIGSLLLGIGIWPMIKERSPYLWLIGFALFLIVAAIIFPKVLAPLYYIWMKIGTALGWLNLHLILTLIFYGMFTPAGILLKIGGKDSLSKKFKPHLSSYWSKRSEESQKNSMKYQF